MLIRIANTTSQCSLSVKRFSPYTELKIVLCCLPLSKIKTPPAALGSTDSSCSSYQPSFCCFSFLIQMVQHFRENFFPPSGSALSPLGLGLYYKYTTTVLNSCWRGINIWIASCSEQVLNFLLLYYKFLLQILLRSQQACRPW